MGICKISWFFLVLGLVSADNCPPLWTSYGKDCYRFFGTPKTWLEAEEHCQEFFTLKGQGHLASIHNPGENQLLIQLWTTSLVPSDDPIHEGHSVWIGLNDRAINGVFAWSDGSTPYFMDWRKEQPNNYQSNQECVAIWDNEGEIGWNDTQCSQDHAYLCKMPSQYL